MNHLVSGSVSELLGFELKHKYSPVSEAAYYNSLFIYFFLEGCAYKLGLFATGSKEASFRLCQHYKVKTVTIVKLQQTSAENNWLLMLPELIIN